jgi:hypothetical protein
MDHALYIVAVIAAASLAERRGAVISRIAGSPETPLLFYFLFLFFGITKTPFLKICLNMT